MEWFDSLFSQGPATGIIAFAAVVFVVEILEKNFRDLWKSMGELPGALRKGRNAFKQGYEETERKLDAAKREAFAARMAADARNRNSFAKRP